MTPEELDLARAKALEFPHARDPISRDEFWSTLSRRKQKAILRRARAIRLSDEARGYRLMPVDTRADYFWLPRTFPDTSTPFRAGWNAALETILSKRAGFDVSDCPVEEEKKS